MRSFSIKVRHFKCFGETEQGFDRFESINLIIGRNNSGKSALLELLRHATSGFKFDSEYNIRHLQRSPEVFADGELAEDELRVVFQENLKGGLINGNHWEYGKKHLGKKYKWRLYPGGNQSHIPIEEDTAKSTLFTSPDFIREYGRKLTEARKNRLQGRIFAPLAAERNIGPELSSDTWAVEANGEGATNLVQKFLNDQDKPREIVEIEILNDLNSILEPDLHIDRILCRRLKNQTWEIYLEEKNKVCCLSLNRSDACIS